MPLKSIKEKRSLATKKVEEMCTVRLIIQFVPMLVSSSNHNPAQMYKEIFKKNDSRYAYKQASFTALSDAILDVVDSPVTL